MLVARAGTLLRDMGAVVVLEPEVPSADRAGEGTASELPDLCVPQEVIIAGCRQETAAAGGDCTFQGLGSRSDAIMLSL